VCEQKGRRARERESAKKADQEEHRHPPACMTVTEKGSPCAGGADAKKHARTRGRQKNGRGGEPGDGRTKRVLARTSAHDEGEGKGVGNTEKLLKETDDGEEDLCQRGERVAEERLDRKNHPPTPQKKINLKKGRGVGGLVITTAAYIFLTLIGGEGGA